MTYDARARRRRMLKAVTHSPIYLTLVTLGIWKQAHGGLSFLSMMDEFVRLVYLAKDVAPDLLALYVTSFFLGPASFYAWRVSRAVRVEARRNSWASVKKRAVLGVGLGVVVAVYLQHVDHALLTSDVEALRGFLPTGAAETVEPSGMSEMMREYAAESARRHPAP